MSEFSMKPLWLPWPIMFLLPPLCGRAQFHSPGILHSFAFSLPHHPYKTVLILEGTDLPCSSLRSPMGTCIHVKWPACGNSFKSIKNHQVSEVLENNWPLFMRWSKVPVLWELISLWRRFSHSVFKWLQIWGIFLQMPKAWIAGRWPSPRP